MPLLSLDGVHRDRRAAPFKVQRTECKIKVFYISKQKRLNIKVNLFDRDSLHMRAESQTSIRPHAMGLFVSVNHE